MTPTTYRSTSATQPFKPSPRSSMKFASSTGGGWLYVLLGLLWSGLLMGCGGSHPHPDTLQITADTPSITAGLTTQLRVVDTNFLKESTDVTSMVTWSSSNPSVATVSTSGLLSGLAAGTTQITASLNKFGGSLTMTIGSPTVTGLSLSPNVVSLYTGGTQQYAATATYANKTNGDVSSSVTWAATPASVATISTTGLLTTVAPGNFIVSATTASHTATVIGSVSNAALSALVVAPASVSITPGASQQFRAVANYVDGTTRDLTDAVVWTSSNPSVLTISNVGLGTTIAGSTGTATVTAQAGSNSATASVQVGIAPSVQTLYIEPTSSSIANGTAEEHTATAIYSDGTQKDVTSAVTWSVVGTAGSSQASRSDHSAAGVHAFDAANGIISVNQSGIDSALSPGTTTLQASLGASQSQSVVIVTAATPVSLAIRSSHSLFPVGSTQQLQLIGTFSDGTTQDLSRTANWQTSNAAVAAIDGAGVASGLRAGDVQFSASFAGLNASTVGFGVLSKNIVSTTVIVPYPAIPRGASEQLEVLGTYSDGTTHDLTSLATWSSADPSVFGVNSGGMIFAQAPGTTQLTAVVNGMSSIASITAIDSTLQTLALRPNVPRFALGTSLAFTALGQFNDGTLVDVTAPAVWTSSDPSVLTIDGNGRAKSGKVGTATVTATLLGVSQTSAPVQVTDARLVSVRVSAPSGQLASGTAQHYKATGIFSDGSFEDISSDVTWDVSDWTEASINASGTVQAMAPGIVQVSAIMQGITAMQPLAITNARMVSVTLSPGNSELPIGLVHQYQLTALFSDGTQQDVTRQAVWSTVTPSIATVVLKGEVIGLGVGVGQITAQYGYFSDATPVNVTNASLTSIAITPSTTTIHKGAQQQLTATGTFSDGFTQSLDLNAVFDSADSTVASVFGNHGLISATGVGSTQIMATFRGMTATTGRFQVVSDTVNALTVSAANASIVSGGTEQLTATATYDDGSTADLSGQVTWTSTDPSLVTIDANGLATASVTNASSNVTVTATYRGVSATFPLTVQTAGTPITPNPPTPNAILTGVSVVPTSSRIAAGTEVHFTARGNYSDGNTLDLTSHVTWTSQNSALASVNANGVATGIAAGVAVIQAHIGSFNSTATLDVTSATLTSVSISPSGTSLAAGVGQQFTLTGSFSDGSQQDLSQDAIWTSTAPAVATISSTGFVRAVAPGSVSFTATYQDQTVTSAAVQVTPAVLLSLSLTPMSPSFAKNTTQQFAVVGTYSDGSMHDLTNVAEYTSSNPSVLSIDADGLATGLATGSAQLTVSFRGQSTTSQTVTVTPATPVSITITPATPTFADGTSQQFTATAIFSDGTSEDLSKQVLWTSSEASVITIDGAGLASAITSGSARISANFHDVLATTGTVHVTPATLVGLTLSPTSLHLARGTSQQFTLTGTFTDGSSQNLSQLATWASSNPAVISVDGMGSATAIGIGSAQLTASYAGLSATTAGIDGTAATLISISTVPANPSVALGTSEQISVTGLFSDGTTQDLSSSASFTSSNAAVASINASGLLVGAGVGTTTITVSANGVTTTSTITVTNAVLTSVAITPSTPPVVAKGTKKQFIATGTFSDGTTQDLSSLVIWTSSNPAVLTVDTAGLATGTGVGAASLGANYQGQSAVTGTVSVGPPSLSSVSISPSAPHLDSHTTQQLVITGTYSDSTTQDLSSQATWSSSDPSVGTVDSSGLVTAVSDGTTTILGQVNGVSSTATLTVKPSSPTVTLLNLTVTPAASSIAQSNTQQFNATGTYSDGSSQNLTSLVTWNTSDPSVATIAVTGIAHGVASGSVTIQAQYNGISGSATLTVSAAPVTLVSIAISPSNGSLTAGNTLQFSATGIYSDGTMQNLTSQVTYQSSVPSVATVNSSGLVTGVSSGNTQIWATIGGQTTAVSLSVSPASLVSLAVTPSAVTLAAGTKQQYKAIGTFSDGSTQDLTQSVAWFSSMTSAATISADGLVVAQGVGSTNIVATSGAITGSVALSTTASVAANVQLSPSTVSLPAGGTLQLIATATFTDGSSQDVTSSVTYVTSDAGLVTVDTRGNLRAIGTGSATIQVTIGSASTTLTVTITPATLTGITVGPTTLNLAAGMSQQLTATGRFSDGSTQDLTSTVVWGTSDLSVATVTTTGILTVAKDGNVTITAYNNGTSGTLALTTSNAVATAIAISPASVTLAAGQPQPFIATATFSDGSQQAVTTSVHWSVSNPTLGTISDSAYSNGVLTTNAAGNMTVSATLGLVTGTASVTVQPASLTSLSVTPNSVSLPAGTTATLSVIGSYTDGSTANLNSSATWSSANTSVAIVDANGIVHGTGVGSTTLTVTVQGTQVSVPVTITNAVLQSINLSPTTLSLAAGLHSQLIAVGTYSDSSTANITTQVQWSSSAPARTTVSSTGLVTAVTAGSATLTATLNSVSQSIPVTVTAAVLQSITVQAPSGSFALGQSLQLSAIGNYSDGNTHDLTSSVTWSSQSSGVGIVSAGGVATGVSVGNFNAVASQGLISGSASVTVTAALLQSITITPANITNINLLGNPVQYTATGHFTDGSTQNLTSSVHWSVSAGILLGSISSTGSFSPLGVGAGTISAVSGTITGSTGFIIVSVL